MRPTTALRILLESILSLAVGLATCPAFAATITVTGAGDTIAVDGSVTLREAIASIDSGANVNADVVAVGTYGTNDAIHFAIPSSGVHTIALTSALPAITKPVSIDGYTQSGASPNTLAVGDNATLLIELSGSGAFGADILTITGGGSVVKGLVINNFSDDGIVLETLGNDVIAGNFIGTNAAGDTAVGTLTFRAVQVSSDGNTIGGTSPAARNVLWASSQIVQLDGASNSIQGNYINVNASGTAKLGTAGDGVVVHASSNTIGGTAAGAGNVISGSSAGIAVLSVTQTTIQGNFIGTNAAGNGAIPNTDGVIVDGNNSLIGGTTAGARNVISGNSSYGIRMVLVSGNVIEGNFIGTDAAGTGSLGNKDFGIELGNSSANNVIGGIAAGAGNTIAFNNAGSFGTGVGVAFEGTAGTGNAIRGNSIHDNAALGIDLGLNGVSANDPGDGDTGPNNLQNFPILTTASSVGGSTTIQGTLNSTSSNDFQIDFYSNTSCDPSGHGEGETYLGSKQVTTDGSGNASFSAVLPVSVSPQARLTATATDPNGNTSEFCSCLSLQAQYHTVTPCRVADTRKSSFPPTYGTPALAAVANRTFVIGGQCGIPTNAQAVAFNFTVTQPSAAGDLRISTGGGSLPLVSAMNYGVGQTRANNAVVPLGPSGDIVVHVDQVSGSSVEFIIDVNGYFQ